MRRSPFVRAARPLFLGGLACVGLTACASVLGIEDRTLIEDSGAPGYDGSPFVGPFADGGGPSPDGSVEALPDGGGSPDSPGAIGDATLDALDAGTSDTGTGADTGTTPVGPACGTACTVVDTLNQPWLLASDDANVYWTEYGDAQGSANGYVKSCPLAGCGPSGPVILAQGLLNPRGIAVDEMNVYFVTASYGGVTGGVFLCAKGGCGGAPTSLATAVIPYGLAVDGTSLYWADEDTSEIRKVAKTGGATTLVYGNTQVISEPLLVAVDGPNLYVNDYNQDAYRLPTAGGGAPLSLGNANRGGRFGPVFGLAFDASRVYLGGDGVLFAANKTVADAPTTLTTGTVNPAALAVDPSSGKIYWADKGSTAGNDGIIGKVSPDGTARAVLASGLETPCAITVAGGYVWWLGRGAPDGNGTGDTLPKTGKLWRQAK